VVWISIHVLENYCNWKKNQIVLKMIYSSLIFFITVLVNNSSIWEQNESLKIRKTMIKGIGNPVHGLGQAQNGGGVRPVNGPWVQCLIWGNLFLF
jgi:hypothetical protein